MKNKKLLVLIIMCVLSIGLTGCTKFVTVDKKTVTNEKNGQRLVQNILCQPNNQDMIDLYGENNIDISTLPQCNDFKITSNGYEGLWTTIFVKPLAYLIVLFTKLIKNAGLAVITITLLIRLALYPITKKTAMQSENMAKAKKELEKIENKYKGKTSQEDQIAHSQEMMAAYKKYNISPFSGCIFALIQIPLFFAFYEAMNRLPLVFEGTFLGLDLGTSPLTAMFLGKWYYIIIVILVSLVTYFSFKLNKTASSANNGMVDMKMMTNMSIAMISIASFTISTSLALYWICNSGFTVVQNLIVKIHKKEKKDKFETTSVREIKKEIIKEEAEEVIEEIKEEKPVVKKNSNKQVKKTNNIKDLKLKRGGKNVK